LRHAENKASEAHPAEIVTAGLGVRLAFSVTGGVLIYLSFPPVDLWPLAYVALVPVVVAGLLSPSRRGAALCGAVCGLVAYLPALFWLSSVSMGGWIGLAIYLALYVVLAVLLVRGMRPHHAVLWPLLAACGWVALELVRARSATGFPWLLYGYTQYRAVPLIQVAAVTGVYGVSFLLVLLNVSLAEMVVGALERKRSRAPLRPAAFAMWVPLSCALIAGALGLGVLAARGVAMRRGPVVGIVQQNFPRNVSEVFGPRSIEEVYAAVRAEIAAAGRLSDSLGPDVQLLVWPETTVQVPLNIAPSLNPDARSRSVQEFALTTLARLGREKKCYMLVGAAAWFPRDSGYIERVLYDTTVRHFGNSAMLFDPRGKFVERYDKVHLVPFGEYVPLRSVLPFLQVFTPMTRDITPGSDYVVFKAPLGGREEARFSALVCYEDVVSELVRRFCREGADFLVNVTDEGWYRPRGELEQHVPMAVFRAVETRTTIVRAANTGISCFISPRGEIYGVLRRDVEGAIAAPVWLCDERPPYVRLGDWFACLCGVVGLLLPLAEHVRRRLRQRHETRAASG